MLGSADGTPGNAPADTLRAARIHELEQRLPGLTRGEGENWRPPPTTTHPSPTARSPSAAPTTTR
ncbi:hypothetical protein QHG49_32155 [Streptomyces sp. WP-1]|nr:hypothetical protein [Streptomyces sp. WP-1]WKE74031.1 hypothetical protein QHG49_32155 [Streptomyces sp. WP-1]